MPITPIIRYGESSSMGAFHEALNEHRRRTQPTTPPIASSIIQTPNSDYTPTPAQRENHVFDSQLSDTDRSILTVDFETDSDYYIYNERYHDAWLEWWENIPGCKKYNEKYHGKKKIHWNSNNRGATVWKSFRQCITQSGKDMGYPHVQCVLCSQILAHPSGVGTSTMNDHHKSQNCKRIRQTRTLRDPTTPTLEELFRSGTKV